jgi:3-oxoacyl-(acyl-carrier-protein) synthase
MNAGSMLVRRPRRAGCVRGATVASAAPPKRRVVVTGMGCVTSLGHDKTTFYKCVPRRRCLLQPAHARADSSPRHALCSNLLAGKSGISQIERWDPHKYELTTTIAGEIKGAHAASSALNAQANIVTCRL